MMATYDVGYKLLFLLVLETGSVARHKNKEKDFCCEIILVLSLWCKNGSIT